MWKMTKKSEKSNVRFLWAWKLGYIRSQDSLYEQLDRNRQFDEPFLSMHNVNIFFFEFFENFAVETLVACYGQKIDPIR